MGEPVKILCVDDEQNVLNALKRLFMDDDYEIFTANSAEEGLELLAQGESFQIVMSDYRMPIINGVDFLREVCRKCPDTVRIVLSGYADTSAVVDAINEGEIYKFIPKPWNDDELRVTIANAVERYFLHQKNQQLMEALTATNEELQLLNENLETLVTERTVELEFQNKVLVRSQNILDSLPVAVIGLNPDGMVAQCNRMGSLLLGNCENPVIGSERRQILPEEVNRFIDGSEGKDGASVSLNINGANIKAWRVSIKHPEQEGTILVLENEACHE